MRAQWRGKPFSSPVCLDIALRWPNSRQHDLDNIKALCDAGTGILYEDDSQICELRIGKGVDRWETRAELAVTPCGT